MRVARRMLDCMRPYWKTVAVSFMMLLGVVAVDLATPRLLQRIVDRGIAAHDLALIVRTSLFMIGLSAVGALLAIGNTILAVRVSQSFGHDLRSALFRKVQTLSFGDLDRLQTGRLMVRLSSDVTLVQQLVMLSLRLLTRAPLMMIGSIILMVVTSPLLAAMMVVLLPATIFVVYLFTSKTEPLFLQVQKRLEKLNTVLQENLAGVRVVKAFVRATYENGRFDQANQALSSDTTHVLQVMALLAPTMRLGLNLGTVGVVWFGGVGVIGGRVTLGQIMAFVNYLTSTMMPLTMLAMMVGTISAAAASAQRAVEVLDIEPEVQDRPGARVLSDVQGRVGFEDVCFSYGADCGEPVLQHVNLMASPGQNVAILGATGSGKSSLVGLIPRFYDATQGRVTVDGVDVREVTLASLHAQMGVALQETVLFRGSVRDNIRYGQPEASDDEVIAAAKSAQAHDFILALPDGYDTQVGQRGVNLSGGQKQRIAIARALLVRPRILILDDSTSAVDVETEAKIETALRDIMRGRTTFVIAQRISTVLNADKIVVLDQGQVAAQGTHAELMASSPIYQEIYASQLGEGGQRRV